MTWLSEKKRRIIRKLLNASQCPCLEQCRMFSGIDCINRDFIECDLFKVLFREKMNRSEAALRVALQPTKRQRLSEQMGVEW